MAAEEDEYIIPLQDQRVFGAGIKRKRVQFVPQSTASTPATAKIPSEGKLVGDTYLSIVLPSTSETTDTELNPSCEANLQTTAARDGSYCRICNLPIRQSEFQGTQLKPHEASLAHQVCLTHSHPPSSLDRHHKGLQYLSAYGWDPDSRLGLGASGEGLRFPIKSTPKHDTVGLGVKLPAKDKKQVIKKQQSLNAKQVRRMDDEGKGQSRRLHEMFYQNEELNRYLGNRI